MSSSKSSVAYHEKMELNNAIVIDDEIVNISSALSYEKDQEKALWVSKAAEQQDNVRFKHSSLNPSKSTP